MKELNFTDKELYIIAQGLQCLSFMMDHGHVSYSGDASDDTVNASIDTIALKIANAVDINLFDDKN